MGVGARGAQGCWRPAPVVSTSAGENTYLYSGCGRTCVSKERVDGSTCFWAACKDAHVCVKQSSGETVSCRPRQRVGASKTVVHAQDCVSGCGFHSVLRLCARESRLTRDGSAAHPLFPALGRGTGTSAGVGVRGAHA